MSFEAKYGGRCGADCGESIKPGQQVRYSDDVLVHEDCDAAIAVERPAVICPDCFMQRPCFCE